MTQGHKHWGVTVRSERLIGFLRKPRWWTTDRTRVDRSPYPYGVLMGNEPVEEIYYLSILSVLHRWTGFAIRWDGN